MAYFPQFPMNYTPMYQPQQYQVQPQMQPQAQQNQQGGVIWVQGEAAAKSYLVAPGATVQLWDSEEKVIYLKSADAAGMPSMKILDYTIRGEAEKPATEYATKDDIAVLEMKIKELSKRRRNTREDESDE